MRGAVGPAIGRLRDRSTGRSVDWAIGRLGDRSTGRSAGARPDGRRRSVRDASRPRPGPPAAGGEGLGWPWDGDLRVSSGGEVDLTEAILEGAAALDGLGWAVVAGVGVVALVVGLLLGRWRARRSAVDRIRSVATRLSTIAEEVNRHLPAPGFGSEPTEPADWGERAPSEPLGERARLDDVLSRLEQLSEAAVESVDAALSDAERLRRVLDSLGLGIVVRDEHGRIAFRNARAEALTGSRHSDLLAAQALEEALDAAPFERPSETSLELYGPPRRTLTVRTVPLDDGRRPIGVAAVLEDVSERRRLEAVRRDFVANVSHELKTPVAALGLLAEALGAEKDPEVASRLATRMQNEAFRVSRVIDDLLDLSRIEAEESPPREPLPLSLVVAEAVERVRPEADRRSIALKAEDPPTPIIVLADRRQLVSAVQNLVDNAVKYSDEGGSVVVRTEESDEGVAIAVIDHGIGIPARDLERIFERFYRVDHGRSRATGGTGLGLAIVRHVAANHGGTVTVSSREGEGSTFTIRLPRDALARR